MFFTKVASHHIFYINPDFFRVTSRGRNSQLM